MYDPNHDPHIGERVLYVDTDEETHHAIIVDDCPGDEYVTLVWSGRDDKELGDDYHHEVESESSVVPHKHVAEDSTSTTHTYLPIHWSYDGEYDHPDEDE